MKYFESPWAILVMVLGFFTFVEVSHLHYHENCKADCPCPLTNEY